MEIYHSVGLSALLAVSSLGLIHGATFAQMEGDVLIQEGAGITERDRQHTGVKEIDSTIQSNPDSTFNVLIEQAKISAQMLVDQEFMEDSNMTEFTVNILAERNGRVTPLLQISVTRFDWQTQPEIEQWPTTYLGGSAMQLLGYVSPDTIPSTPQTSANARGRSNPGSGSRQTSPGNLNAGSSTRRRSANSRDNSSNSRYRSSSSSSPATIRQSSTATPSSSSDDNDRSPRFSREESDPGYR